MFRAVTHDGEYRQTICRYQIANASSEAKECQAIVTHVWNIAKMDSPKWRQVFKALSLIDFLIKNGSRRFVEDCRTNQLKIRQFREFSCMEDGVDRGQGVREQACHIMDLLNDRKLLDEEREKATQNKDK